MILAFVRRDVLPGPRAPDSSGVSRGTPLGVWQLYAAGYCCVTSGAGEWEVARLDLLTDAGQEVGDGIGEDFPQKAAFWH